MNYIKQLQEKIREMEEEARRKDEGIAEFLSYLSSSKFHNDTTVQVKDVINRIVTFR